MLMVTTGCMFFAGLGLHRKKCDQQAEGGDCPPLLHSSETPQSAFQ